MHLMYLPLPERACGMEYNRLSRRETDAHWLSAHDGLRQDHPRGLLVGPQGMRADSTGHICRVCVEERQKFREEGEDGVDFKVRNSFFFLKRPHLARNESKIENMSDEIRGREEFFPAHGVCVRPRSAYFKFLLGKM